MPKTVLLMLLLSLAAWSCRGDRAPAPADKGAGAGSEAEAKAAKFVSVKDGRFVLAGKPH